MYNIPLELRHLNPSENSPNRVKCHKIFLGHPVSNIAFLTQDLSGDCEEFIVELEKEAALDYRLNPSLAKACKQEVSAFHLVLS